MKICLEKINQPWLPIVFGLLALLIYYVPFLVFGDDTYIRVLDCLDNDVAHFKMIVNQNAIFDYDKTLPLLYGIPRTEFIVRFLPIWIFYYIFPPFWAFVANDFTVRLISLLGMYLLLQRVVLTKDRQSNRWIAAIVAVLYSYIPFYTIYGLSAAGIPLLIYSFYNLQYKQKLAVSFLLIALFSLYSHLELIGPFAGVVLGAYYVVICIHRKSWNIPFLVGLCVFVAGYLISCWDLVVNFLFPVDFVSHRIEFQQRPTLHAIYADMKQLFEMGRFHCGNLHIKVIVVVIAVSFGLQIWKRKLNKPLLITSIALVGTFSLCVAGKLMMAYVPFDFFAAFTADRFFFFLPSLWMIAFACALGEVAEDIRWGSVVAMVLASLMIPTLYNTNAELKSGIRQLQGREPERPTYRQFYDVELFNVLAEDLNIESRTEIKVACLGMHPAVAQYNGFYTIDGYWDMYRLEYKHAFRRVISGELAKSEEIQKYFDGWGNRCYLFSAELGREYIFDKNCGRSVKHLDINTNALADLGCQYIFAAVPIDNHESLDLKLLNTYDTPNSYRRIWVYEIDKSDVSLLND